MLNCLLCNSENLKELFYQKEVPGTLSSPKNKNAPEIIGELSISQCQNCGYIFNATVNQKIINKIYAQDYSACLPLSPVILQRLEYICENLIHNENIYNNVIIEIGSSDFTFSEILLKKGAKEVIAFEPSSLFTTQNPKITHINNYLTETEIQKYSHKTNLIVMRHVLEHVLNPMDTLRMFSKYLNIDGLLYIEVPNIEDILEKNRPYDFFYEHVSYFSPQQLSDILKLLGFEIVNLCTLVDGQHFGVLAKKIENNKSDCNIEFSNFSVLPIDNFKSNISKFYSEISEIIDQSRSLAIYGAGGHAVSTTTYLELNSNKVKYLLDNSPIKADTLSPLCKIPIKVPTTEILEELDDIIVIASLHQQEIFHSLRDNFKFKGNIYGTYPNFFKM